MRIRNDLGPSPCCLFDLGGANEDSPSDAISPANSRESGVVPEETIPP